MARVAVTVATTIAVVTVAQIARRENTVSTK